MDHSQSGSKSVSEASLYCELPHHIKQDKRKLGLKPLNCSAKDYVASFVSHSIKQNNSSEELETKLNHRPVMLDSVKLPKQNRKRKSRSMPARERREKKVYDLAPEHHRFVLYLPLHKLWKEYMQDMLNLQPNSNLKTVYPRLMKADFHGCLLTVCRSKCPSYIGCTGILLQETRNVFRIITKDDKLKTIPKANSVFSFELMGFMFMIYGNQFRFRASERSVRKFKSKATVDL